MVLYADFLKNDVSYDAVQAMWKDWLDVLAVKHGFSYAPYLNPYLANGEKERDGNPIFNALVAVINRGVSIIQEIPQEEEDLYIHGYLVLLWQFRKGRKKERFGDGNI